MTALPNIKVDHGDESVITVFAPGHPIKVAHSSHSQYDKIVAGVAAGDESVLDLFDVAEAVAVKFERLSERVTAENGRIFLDGDEIHDALSQTILAFLEEGVEDWRPLVAFFEKVQANPTEHSREQLYRWIEKHQLTLTPEGNIVAYKGVRKGDDGEYTSINQGPARVNDIEVTGYVPNPIGATVELARSQVVHDPSVACSVGLHVGTFDYAKTWSRSVDAVLECEVNPRDVVSVPTHSNDQKVRVCRYVIRDVIENPYDTVVRPEAAKAEEPATASEGISVGDRVVTSNPTGVGEVTTVDSDDDELPYYVTFDNGDGDWFAEDEVKPESEADSTDVLRAQLQTIIDRDGEVLFDYVKNDGSSGQYDIDKAEIVDGYLQGEDLGDDGQFKRFVLSRISNPS